MTHTLIRVTLLAAVSAVLAVTFPGDVPCCELRYTVRPDPVNSAVEVELELHGFRGDSLILDRPSTRPLTGLMNQDPRVDGVRRVHWSLRDGAPRWTFARPAGGWSDPVVIRYRLAIPAERPVNAWSAGLDRDLLYAPAEALFLTPAMGETAARNAAIHVAWELPERWDRFNVTDTQYAVASLRVLVVVLAAAMLAIKAKVPHFETVRLSHVRREQNSAADALANQAIDAYELDRTSAV